MQNSLQILQETFGYQHFRYPQEKIITKVLQGKDTLVLMPTGGGKSLCYQIPALMLEGVAVVVSPLISLMKDQVDALQINGVPAAYLNSSLSKTEQQQVINRLKNKELKLLYLAPERLISQERQFVHFLQKVKVSMLAIDEAHCISQWGHDFRPEYAMLAEVKKALQVPVIALTATADQLTRKDILEKLELSEPEVFISSFNRENIYYQVAPKRNSYTQLLSFLEKRKSDAGIIYVLSRNSAEDLARRLSERGFAAKPYHAGLSSEEKDRHQQQFLRDDTRIIVATVAFGMGINKSNVRYVVHMDLPKNIEGYYQETGRAGRDGLPSEALLFYSYADVVKLRKFVEVEGNTVQSEVMQKKLQEMASFGELQVCRRQYLLQYFGEKTGSYCGQCDVCLSEYEKFDGTVIAQKVLSAVARLEESYGVAYVVDLLRGSNAEKIKPQHKALKTYGVGADVSKKEWLRYIDYLLYQGYLKKTESQFSVLQLTDKSWAVLKGNEKVMLVKEAGNKNGSAVQEGLSWEVELLQLLKDVRRQLAQQANVPAYIIFSDATLQELVRYLPLQTEDLRHISGFGEVKIGRYGQQFLDVLQEFVQRHDLASRIKKSRFQKKKTAEKGIDTKAESLKLLRQGKTVEQIAVHRNLHISTVYGHLSYYVAAGNMEVTDLLKHKKVAAIEQVLNQVGGETLKPVKEALGKEVSYGEIQLVVAHWKRKLSK